MAFESKKLDPTQYRYNVHGNELFPVIHALIPSQQGTLEYIAHSFSSEPLNSIGLRSMEYITM